MQIYVCKPGCKCPDCDPSQKLNASFDQITKSLAFVNDLKAAQAYDPSEPFDAAAYARQVKAAI